MTVDAAAEHDRMGRALAAGASVRRSTPPNPWVGAVVTTTDGRSFVGATEPPGGRHAEIVALDAARDAGADLEGATVVVTLEPCCHQGRTGPCTDALVAAGVTRVVVGVADPDPLVAGAGIARLRAAGVAVEVGLRADEVTASLRAYLHHRRTGRPFVVLKLAATLDGRTAAPDGTSQWITGPVARAEVHRMRAESDGVLVGAGTVRADDPRLTVRDGQGPDPQRIVLGTAPPGAHVHPCWEVAGDLGDVLRDLGGRGILHLLVEGGAGVATALHRAGLVDRYVLHLAPALAGGDDGRPLFAGPGAPTIDALWRGRLVSSRALGDDLEVVIEPVTSPDHPTPTPAARRRGGTDAHPQ
ncbi:MAG TPA: bifunctional diaminohydroxyphosphoribosylaminopyrimidine deaminase/5-amino-6-(5-phosphoribosylamino)uracil reductase RibD [Acidimicrobiales bacterium]|nr:bifunctional diaminohydroxyphosphoribosylaminopyrimidine deaminase/5-amino-6-(5-phosphoribosylamino)uracil reductase RibD [Acidimicrobiales bacterium]